jgi:hypothetical protein
MNIAGWRFRVPSHALAAAVGVLGILTAVSLTGLNAAASASAASIRTSSSTLTPGCTDDWTGGGPNPDWTTAANWTAVGNASVHKVPGPSAVACISQPGSEAVVDESAAVGRFIIGGSSGTATVLIESEQSALTINHDSVIGKHGVLELGNSTSCQGIECNSYVQGTAGGGQTVTNHGVISTAADSTGSDYLYANVVNDGTMTLDAPLTDVDIYQYPVTLTNNATIDVGKGAKLAVTSGSSTVANFVNPAKGKIDNLGTVVQAGGGSATFTERGMVEGNPVQLSGVVLNDDTSAGAASFEITGTSDLTGSGSSPGIAAKQKVTIDSTSVYLYVETNLTNDGSIVIGNTAGAADARLIDPANVANVVTNDGTITAPADSGGIDYLEANVVNDGTMSLGAPSTVVSDYQAPETVTNNATIDVAKKAGLSVVNSDLDNASAGTISNLGTFAFDAGDLAASFTERGVTTGHVIQISGAYLDDDTSAGAALFEVTSSSDLTGSGSSPGIAAGQTITIDSNTVNCYVETNLVNHGTIVLGNKVSTGSVTLLDPPNVPKTITNDGTITSAADSGGIDYLEADVVNNGTMSLDAASTVVSDYQAPETITNKATLNVGGTATVTFVSSSLTEGSSAILGLTNNVTAKTASTIRSGDDTLNGELKVTTIGTAGSGTTYTPISGASITGTFKSEAFGSKPYSVSYTPSSVVLTAKAPALSGSV